MLTRRGLIGALIVAPAIVRVTSLMPIKVYREGDILALLEERIAASEKVTIGSINKAYYYGYEMPSIHHNSGLGKLASLHPDTHSTCLEVVESQIERLPYSCLPLPRIASHAYRKV